MRLSSASLVLPSRARAGEVPLGAFGVSLFKGWETKTEIYLVLSAYSQMSLSTRWLGLPSQCLMAFSQYDQDDAGVDMVRHHG